MTKFQFSCCSEEIGGQNWPLENINIMTSEYILLKNKQNNNRKKQEPFYPGKLLFTANPNSRLLFSYNIDFRLIYYSNGIILAIKIFLVGIIWTARINDHWMIQIVYRLTQWLSLEVRCNSQVSKSFVLIRVSGTFLERLPLSVFAACLLDL